MWTIHTLFLIGENSFLVYLFFQGYKNLDLFSTLAFIFKDQEYVNAIHNQP